MFAFSGMNGAGKSTFLRSAWLIQKAHFLNSGWDNESQDLFFSDVARFLNDEDSYVRITLEDSIAEEQSPVQEVTITLRLNFSTKQFLLEYTDLNLANKIWDISNPSNIILYVDASKGFSEETLRFDELSIDGNDKNNLALEVIYHPERLFSGIYRQLVKDYVHSRLIPSKPDRMLYYHVAAKLFSQLIPNVELKNFSGKHKPNEFVLLGKANTEERKPLYDVREFSSGEKALLSTLTFLCISKSVSALIIDEPENHFHESLLLEFMSMLHSLCRKDGIVNWISAQDSVGKKINLEWMNDEYKGHNLSQVIVSTHSKSLIYKFFSLGRNYVVNKRVNEIAYDQAESVLRSIGLSTTFTKVVFVEGDGDNESLENLLSSQNIKIVALQGCSAVIETFERLALVKDYIQDSRFVFLVDSDNKPATFFNDIRTVSPDFYDGFFIKLDAHEFENLYLDSNLFKKVLDKVSLALTAVPSQLTVDDVKSELVKIAKESLPKVYKKETSLLFNQVVERHFAQLVWGDRNFKWTDVAVIHSQLANVCGASNASNLNVELSQAAQEVFQRYSNISDDMLLKRCDGKQVLNKACVFFGANVGVQKAKFKDAIYIEANSDSGSAVTLLAEDIISRLNKK
jgi:ABC-type multidrug transport system ATPase subunit